MNFKYYSTLILLLLFNSPLTGMYRITQGLRRGSAALTSRMPKRFSLPSLSHHKPVLKKITVVSGGFASFGGVAYGLQAYNQRYKKEQKREEKVRKAVEYKYLDDKSNDEKIVNEIKLLWKEVGIKIPVVPVVYSGRKKIDTASLLLSCPDVRKMPFAVIQVDPRGQWSTLSNEAKQAVLAHEYGHWLYYRKHGWEAFVDWSSKKEQELYADQVSVAITGSAQGLLEALDIDLSDRGLLDYWNIKQEEKDIQKMSSVEMQELVDQLWVIERDRSYSSVHPIPILRAVLAIQYEKSLKERQQYYYDATIG